MSEFPSGYFGTPDTEAKLERLAPFKRHLARFIQSLPKGARVLDVGCGAGKTIKLMQSLRPDLVINGMDISDVKSFLPQNVGFTQGSVEDLTSLYKSEHFDAIICQHVVEHVLYPMGLMNGITSLLKSGGKLFIETPNWTRTISPWSHFYFWNDYTHVRPFTRFSMHRLLAEHGLEPQMIRTLSSTTWLVRQGDSGELKHASSVAQHRQHFITRVFARLVNPLMRDLLIAIAKK